MSRISITFQDTDDHYQLEALIYKLLAGLFDRKPKNILASSIQGYIRLRAVRDVKERQMNFVIDFPPDITEIDDDPNSTQHNPVFIEEGRIPEGTSAGAFAQLVAIRISQMLLVSRFNLQLARYQSHRGKNPRVLAVWWFH
jgi:hypothetical protein